VAVVLGAKRAERRNPPIGRFIEIDGLRLHYLERGNADAPAVVLFHGNGAMIQDLAGAGLIDLLARRYRVICFDRPGFGYSRRPRLRLMTPEAQAALFEAALQRLNVHEPVVFGHSWGALVALALALRVPQSRRSAKGLVLAAGYYFPTVRWDVWMVSGPAIPIIGDIMCYTISPILGWLLSRAVIRTLFAPDEVPQAFKDQFPLALALRPSQLRATAEESALMIPAAARLQARYRNLSCPLAIYSATGDSMVEADQAPRLQRITTASVLHTVRGAGHMLHYAVPEAIVGAVDDMMASVRLVGSPRLAPSDCATESASQARNAR
jgi:pimeloyl-ACP methyl ester carboxylesterase